MFAFAKCGHCGKSGTKIVEIEPNGALYKQSAICCSHCTSILSVTGYYDTGALLKQQEKRLAQMEQQIGNLTSEVQRLAQILSRR